MISYFQPPCLLFIFSLFLLTSACKRSSDHYLFMKLEPSETGIDFSNTITYTNNLNVHDNPYIYLGGGVAAGDLSGNGLPDLFFTGNQVSSRLYFNKGNMTFEDVTESSGVSTSVWATGASIVDINGNGLLDIYVSVGGLSGTSAEERANQLFINNGDGTFTESASLFNLADTSYTTHAAFFDFNLNGYLDVYLLNNYEGDFASGAIFHEGDFRTGSTMSFDKLYRNNGDGTFTDISEEAGILREIGYGLGIAITDINRNGLPDIYISNDLDPNSLLYINNGDGTFTEKGSSWFKKTSLAGMGTDVADINNNGWPDIIASDMMPESLMERKMMSGSIDFDQQQNLINRGINYQYSLNTLQLSNGMKKDGSLIFSEIGRQAGIAYSDWSWSVLLADFTNNQHKDLLITNGFPKAVYDFDYKIEEFRLVTSNQPNARANLLQTVEDLRDIRLPNYIYANDGELGFINKTIEWGLSEYSYSYGAAYVDLNNNGKLDLVINNINQPAFVYKNKGFKGLNNSYLKVALRGNYPNTFGIGSEVIVTANGTRQFLYHSPFRGYQSTVDHTLHFGLGNAQSVDSLEIYWPDGSYQLIRDIPSNQTVTITQNDAIPSNGKPTLINFDEHPFTQDESTPITSLVYQETYPVNDFSIQPHLPHRLSQSGPVLAAGDVTGNGLDDLFIGGTNGVSGQLFFRMANGEFVESSFIQGWEEDKRFKDTGAHFFDANGNGHLDLYVASGGYEFHLLTNLHQDRLYINDGNGKFTKAPSSLPLIHSSTKAITSADFTGNGLNDLFVGGRFTPHSYPNPARSFLLINEAGTFTDGTEQYAPQLKSIGMITDARWADINNNGLQDLVLTGIFQPVRFFLNNGLILSDQTDDLGLPPTQGWWYSLETADLTNNGYPDFVAGNLGLNHTFTTSLDDPLELFALDFNQNGITDLFFTKRFNHLNSFTSSNASLFSRNSTAQKYPFFGLAKYGREHHSLMRQYRSFVDFSKLRIQEIFDENQYEQSDRYRVDTFESTLFLNNGDGTFETHSLPPLAQISPVKSILLFDVEGSGSKDIILAGNIFETHPEIPRADAGNGLWLKNDGTGNFTPISAFESGFIAPGDVKSMVLLNSQNGYSIVVGNNNNHYQKFEIKK